MRLIDADALMKDISDSLDQMTDIGIAVDGDWLWAKLNDAIDNAPIIDPVKHGDWIVVGNPQRGGIEWVHCSECGYTYSAMWENPHNYCPNCGARMDGEEG